MTKRTLAVNGQFYPDTKEELNRYIDHFNDVLNSHNLLKKQNNVKAIIVPHAGYIYSGFTANFAYRYIPKDVKNIIVIGPSHKFRFDGASVALYDKYPTPLGDLNINTQLSEKLIVDFDFLTFNDKVHCEHSTETQFPFIKKYLPDAKVVEIIYGDIDYNHIALMINDLIKDSNNFIVISTDLSHFYDINTAKKIDNICLNSIEKKDINIKENGCEACGMIGIKAIIEVSKKENLNFNVLDYRTSEDVTKDYKRVVGYASILIF